MENAKNFSVMTTDQKDAIVSASVVKFESLNKWKESNYKMIAGTYGPETAKTVLKAVKAEFAAKVEELTTNAAANLSYSDILEYAFRKLSANSEFAALSEIVKQEYKSASAFVAACFPHVSDNGRPLRRVSFINTNGGESFQGMTIYDAFIPFQLTAVNAVSVLMSAFKVFSRAASKTIASTAKKITFAKVEQIAVSVAAYSVETARDAKGFLYLIKGDEIDAPAVPVSALVRLSDYNAAIKQLQREKIAADAAAAAQSI